MSNGLTFEIFNIIWGMITDVHDVEMACTKFQGNLFSVDGPALVHRLRR